MKTFSTKPQEEGGAGSSLMKLQLTCLPALRWSREASAERLLQELLSFLGGALPFNVPFVRRQPLLIQNAAGNSRRAVLK